MKATAAVGAAIFAVIALLYVATVPNVAPAEMTEAEIARIVAEVRAAATEQHDTWISQEDLTAHVSSHSAWAGNPWGGTRTLDQMRERQRNMWARWDYDQTSAPAWEVRVIGPDVAAVKGSLELTRTDTTGLVQTYTADWAHVWIIEDGVWKILVAKEAADFGE